MKKEGQRIFIGCYPTGLVYSDRWVEKDGDYKRLAYLNYGTLKLEIQKDCPGKLADEIIAHSKTMKRGESFQIAGNLAVTLGSEIK
jgi:hypothetical protein